MSLANSEDFYPPGRVYPRDRYGIILRIVPGNIAQKVSIERAPDSGGSPGSYTELAEIGPIPQAGIYYVDQRANDGATWWYRARHVGPDVDPGAYITAVSGVAMRLNERLLSAQSLASHEALNLRSDVRGHAAVSFGGSGAIRFPVTRHNEQHSATDGGTVTFDQAFEAIPEVRVLPQDFILPGTSSTSSRKIEFKATNISTTGCTVRAKMQTGASFSAQSNDFASSLNGTPNASGITLTTNGAAAYCNLAGANNVETTYYVHYDVDTSAMSPGKILYVKIYKNAGVSSTSWTEVASAQYTDGITATDEILSFTAQLPVDYDVRLVITYSDTHPPLASVVADRVTYDAVTLGTEETLTGTGSALLVQALEAS